MLLPLFDIENGPENQIIPSCLAELRHSAAAKSDNLNITKTPHLRGFYFPAIRQGYSRDALHQYPCHIVVNRIIDLLRLTVALRSGAIAPSVIYINKNVYSLLDGINKNVYTYLKLNRQEEEVKQSELRRWLAAQGAEFKDGTNHLKIYLNGKQTVMPRHPGKEIPEPLRKAILKQLGIK